MAKLLAAQRDTNGRFLPGHGKLGGERCALTPELADEIAIRIAEGETHRQVAQDLRINFWTLLAWIYRGENETHRYLQERVRLAREAQADALAADLLRRASTCPPDIHHAAALREFAGVVRWLTAVLNPSRYSKNATVDTGAKVQVGVAVYLPERERDED